MSLPERLPERLPEAFPGLSAGQVSFLELAAMAPPQKPEELEMKFGVTRTTLGAWMCQPAFRAAYMAILDSNESLYEPAFWARVRQMAMGDGKDAEKWARIYAKRSERRAPVILNVTSEPGLTGEEKDGASDAELEKDDLEDLFG